MALNQKDLMKYGWLGFLAGIATGFILKFISQIVSAIPGVSLDLQSITVGTTGLGGIIKPELGQKLLGLIPAGLPLTIPEFIGIGVGGAVFVILGAWIVDSVKALQIAKTKQGKLATILVVAGVASGWILSMAIGLPALSGIIVLAVNAYILSWILVFVDDNLGTKLIP